MSDDKVLQFPGGSELPEMTLTAQRDRTLFCKHDKLTLNEHDRTMSCVGCGAALDPFNYLLSNALHLQRAWQDHGVVKKELTELIDRVSELKKEKQRLTGQVARLKEKLPTISTRVITT